MLDIRDKVFKNKPSKICGRQFLKNFTWSNLEYFVPQVGQLAGQYSKSTQKHFTNMLYEFKVIKLASVTDSEHIKDINSVFIVPLFLFPMFPLSI